MAAGRRGIAQAAFFAALAGFAAVFLIADREPAGPRVPSVVHSEGSDGRVQLAPGRELTFVTPDGESRTVRSLLDIRSPMSFGSFVWNESGSGQGEIWIRVDLTAQTLSVFRGADEIAATVILYGAPGKPTPLGWHRVTAKAIDHYSRSYDAPMPFMLRLTEDGVALHASVVREGFATNGCIGMPHAFARRVFEIVEPGARVLIEAPAARS